MVKVRTPTRIDLSGGTLDLFPLHQFAYPTIYSTINLAINLFNEVEVKKNYSSEIIIRSVDLNQDIKFDDLNSLQTFLCSGKSSPLILGIKSINFFEIEGITMEINSSSPRGSGLGNSSSLLIGILYALNLLGNKNLNDDKLIVIAQAIETSVLKIPTGSQDYIAALHGGLNRKIGRASCRERV